MAEDCYSKYTVIDIRSLQYLGSAVTACDFPQDFWGSAYDLGILCSNLGTFLLCLRKVHFTCNIVVFSHKYTMSKPTVLLSVMILQLLFTFLADLYTPHTQTSRHSFAANCNLILICGKNFTYTDNFGYILGCWQFLFNSVTFYSMMLGFLERESDSTDDDIKAITKNVTDLLEQCSLTGGRQSSLAIS